MSDVFQKTRELGEALMESEEYMKMKAAEEKAMRNAEAAETMGRYLETKQTLEEMMRASSADYAKMKEISEQMDELQSRLQMIDDITELTRAREGFSQLINQVNSVLRFIVTGVMEGEEDGGCGGNCHACPGSCHVN